MDNPPFLIPSVILIIIAIPLIIGWIPRNRFMGYALARHFQMIVYGMPEHNTLIIKYIRAYAHQNRILRQGRVYFHVVFSSKDIAIVNTLTRSSIFRNQGRPLTTG